MSLLIKNHGFVGEMLMIDALSHDQSKLQVFPHNSCDWLNYYVICKWATGHVVGGIIMLFATGLQGYGLTETCAASFLAGPFPGHSGTVGPPVPGTEFRLEGSSELG